MVSRVFILASIAAVFTSAWAQDQPTCYADGNTDNAACGQFVNNFCNLIGNGPFPSGSKGTACYMANGHRCDFTAYNSASSSGTPTPANCKAVLNSAVQNCNTGGRGKYSSSTTFIFAIDPNDGNCNADF